MNKNTIKLLIMLALIIILASVSIPKLASFYHNRGVQAYDKKMYKEAAAFFRKSLNMALNTDTYDYLAHTYEKLQKTDKAVEIYRKIISGNPFYSTAYIALSEIYLGKRMFSEAVSLLEKAQEVIPNDQDIIKLLDTAYSDYAYDVLNQSLISYMTGKKLEAYALLYKVLELMPDTNSAYMHYILGYYHYADNKLDLAELKMKDVIRIEPEYWQAHKLLGDIFFKQHEYDKAVMAYQKALNLNHSDYTVYNDIGIALTRIERYEQAIVYLKEALRFNPDNLDIIFNLASAYRDASLFDQAILEYGKLSAYDSGYPNMHNNLAEIYIAQGRRDLAVDAYHKEIRYTQQRLSHNPDDVSELNNLARAYSGTGDYQKAKAIIEKVIIMMPDYRDAYITLAMIEEKENNLDAALEALRTAKTFAAHTGFIDKYIADIKNKAHPSLKAAHTARPKEIFIPSHKILFKSGRSIEGTVHSKTEDEVVLSVLAGKSELKLVFRADDIDVIISYDEQPE
jgi:tetratricopeptide (TPR) repeat protein